MRFKEIWMAVYGILSAVTRVHCDKKEQECVSVSTSLRLVSKTIWSGSRWIVQDSGRQARRCFCKGMIVKVFRAILFLVLLWWRVEDLIVAF